MTLPVTHENLSLDTYIAFWKRKILYYQNLVSTAEQMKLDAPAIKAEVTDPDSDNPVLPGTSKPTPKARAANPRGVIPGALPSRHEQAVDPKTRFKDTSSADAAVICLMEAGGPLKPSELAQRILAGGKTTKAKSYPSNLTQQFRINPERFVSFGDGLWGLTEWGKPA